MSTEKKYEFSFSFTEAELKELVATVENEYDHVPSYVSGNGFLGTHYWLKVSKKFADDFKVQLKAILEPEPTEFGTVVEASRYEENNPRVKWVLIGDGTWKAEKTGRYGYLSRWSDLINPIRVR